MPNTPTDLWPIRWKPFKDELLSSWLVRLAHGHGLKVQSFSHLVFGRRHQLWNRDIDRLAPAWLLDELCAKTALDAADVFATTLRTYDGTLYHGFRHAGNLPWILALRMYHRTHQAFGMQFCPVCLASDRVPYFRKCWRLAFNTQCYEHDVMLLDRCSHCGASIAVHRIDMSAPVLGPAIKLSQCWQCGKSLAQSRIRRPKIYADDGAALLQQLSQDDELDYLAANRRVHQLAVLHHLCALMTTHDEHVHLQEFSAKALRKRVLPASPGRLSIEARPTAERHHILQLAAWMMSDLDCRLTAAWRSGAVRYNMLLKGFIAPPVWYKDLVSHYSDWRHT